jgi:hypothetical protein
MVFIRSYCITLSLFKSVPLPKWFRSSSFPGLQIRFSDVSVFLARFFNGTGRFFKRNFSTVEKREERCRQHRTPRSGEV